MNPAGRPSRQLTWRCALYGAWIPEPLSPSSRKTHGRRSATVAPSPPGSTGAFLRGTSGRGPGPAGHGRVPLPESLPVNAGSRERGNTRLDTSGDVRTCALTQGQTGPNIDTYGHNCVPPEVVQMRVLYRLSTTTGIM